MADPNCPRQTFMVNGCIYTDHSEIPKRCCTDHQEQYGFSVLTLWHVDRRTGYWITNLVIRFSVFTHPLVLGFWVQAPLHSFHPQLLFGRVHVEESFSAQVQFLKTRVIKPVTILDVNKASERTMYTSSWSVKYCMINSHWPQSINIRRFCVTAEPWLKAAVRRLAVHIPRSCEKPKETKSGAGLMCAIAAFFFFYRFELLNCIYISRQNERCKE